MRTYSEGATLSFSTKEASLQHLPTGREDLVDQILQCLALSSFFGNETMPVELRPYLAGPPSSFSRSSAAALANTIRVTTLPRLLPQKPLPVGQTLATTSLP